MNREQALAEIEFLLTVERGELNAASWTLAAASTLTRCRALLSADDAEFEACAAICEAEGKRAHSKENLAIRTTVGKESAMSYGHGCLNCATLIRARARQAIDRARAPEASGEKA